MKLFLKADLVKAIGVSGASGSPGPVGGSGGGSSMSPSTGSGGPSISGGGDQYQPCSVGGGEACLRAGGNGHDTHKVGGSIERRHAEYTASAGAGAAQTETAADASTTTPEEVMEAQQQAAPSSATLDPNATQGTTSTNSEDYPEDSNPLDHYMVGDAHHKMGGGNNSAKEIAEGHRQIARKRAEKFTAEEHSELADKLDQAGLGDDAKFHRQEAEKQRKLEEEQQEALGREFDSMMEDTKDVPDKLDEKDESVKRVEKLGQEVEQRAAEKRELKDSDPYAAALKEWEEDNQKIENEHAAAVEEYKKKVDSEHEQAVSDWEKKDKEYKDWEKQLKDHEKNTPEEPEPYTGERPKASDYDLSTPAGKAAFDSDVKEHTKASTKAKKEKAAHRAKKHAHTAEGRALKKKKPENPGKKPKHPGYTKNAPKKKEAPEKPKQEDFEMKKPQSAAENAVHKEYTQSANKARENLQSHLENNPDLSPEEKQKLQAVYEALEGHVSSERMPSKDQQKELKEMIKVAGKHGKEAYQAPEESEEVKAPQSDLEKIQHSDHQNKAKELRDNIQAHIEAIENDSTMSPEQKTAKVDQLRKIHESLEKHTTLETMPTSEEQSEMKELTKLAGEHGKKPKEPTTKDSANTKNESTSTRSSSRGRSTNWAAAFGRGAHAGARLAEAARTGTGGGALGAQALGIAAGGVMTAGETLLHKPANEALKQQKNSDVEADQKARKEDASKPKKEETVKGLYLSLDSSEDLIKAVNSPNAGRTTMTGSRAKEVTEASYSAHPVGVLGGAEVAMEDDPDQGKQWKHGEDEEDEAEKAIEVLKALEQSTRAFVPQYNPRELEFMQEVLGYSLSDIKKGLVKISGKNRHRFHEWSIERMNKSLYDMFGALQ